MARRLSNLSVLLAAMLVVSLIGARNGWGQVGTTTVTSVEELNNLLGQTVTAGATITLNEHIGTGVLPLRYLLTDTTAMTGAGGNTAYNLRINKTGSGTWRLGSGANSVLAGASNHLLIQEGTLELMHGTSLTLDGAAAVAQRYVSISNGAALNVRGENTIAAGQFRIADNVTLGFDLTRAGSDEAAQTSTPLLTIDANVTSSTGGDINGTFNLLGFGTQTDGTITLLQYTYTGTALTPGPPTYPSPPIRIVTQDGYGANFELMVRGQTWAEVIVANERLSGTLTQVTVAGTATGTFTTTIGMEDLISKVGRVTWTGSTDGVWNATTDNWDGTEDISTTKRFLHGDTVTFTAAGAAAQSTVTVQAGGVQIGDDYTMPNGTRVYGMNITGGDYIFQNEGTSTIGIDGGGTVRIGYAAGATEADVSVIFKSANSYWGGTLIDARATVTLEHSGGLGTGTVTINAGGTLVFDTKAALPLSEADVFFNEISGTGVGDVVKKGNNIVRIDGAVNSSSNTTVEAGTLQNNIARGVLTVYKDAVYEALGVSRVIAGLSDGPLGDPNSGGGTVDMGTKPANQDLALIIDVPQSAPGYEFSGVVTGTGAAVYKNGDGTQTFSGQNTYTGGTIVTGGVLVGKRVLDNFDEDITPFGTGSITVGQSATLRFDITQDPPADPTLVASLAATNHIHGDGTVEKVGDGILSLLSNASTYRGITDVKAGYLRLEHRNATGKTYEVRLADDTRLQFGSGVVNNLGSTVTAPYDRVISGSGGVDVLNNTTVYVSGTTMDDEEFDPPPRYSSYTGETTLGLNANLILLNPEGTGRTSKVDLTDDTSTLTLYFNRINDEDGREIEQLYDRYITGAGNLEKNGTGVAVLDAESAPNDYTGMTYVRNGTLKLMYAGATGAADNHGAFPPEQSVQVDANGILELAFDGNYDKGISGDGAIAKSGDGTTTLRGLSTYGGGTYIYGGTLSYTDLDPQPGNLGTGGVFFRRGGGTLQNRNAVADFNQNIVIDGGSTAIFDTQGDLTVPNTVTITHRTLNPLDPYYDPDNLDSHFVKRGAADMTINANMFNAGWTGTTTVEEGWLINNIPEQDDGQTQKFTDLTVFENAGYRTGDSNRRVASIWGEGTIDTAAGRDFTVHYTDTETPDEFNGDITGDGNLVLYGHGTRAFNPTTGEMETRSTTLILNGPNDYSGSTTVDGSYGVLVGNIAHGTALTVNTTGTYRAGNANRMISSLQGSGVVDMQNRNLTINQNDTAKSYLFRGTIINGRNFSKLGYGEQRLAGLKYFFAEDFRVDAGTLKLGSNSRLDVGGNVYVAPNVTDGGGQITQRTVLYVDRRTHIDADGNLNVQGTLSMVVGDSMITAESVTLGDGSVLNVSGISSTDIGVVIIRSDTPIEDNFDKITIADSTEPTADYLLLGVSKSADKREILVGQTLRWYAPADAHGTFTIEELSGSYKVAVPLVDIEDPSVRPNWNGNTLTKEGPGTLILEAENTYTGPTRVNEGTLLLLSEKAVSKQSTITLNGAGLLRLDFNSRNEDGTWTDGLKAPITGTGPIEKVGYGNAVLSGTSDHSGPMYVLEGAVLVDGSIGSRVWVSRDAGFGGNGILDNGVTFESGSYFLWRYGRTEAGSDTLTVNGRVDIGDDVRIRVMSKVSAEKLPTKIEGWTILRYGDGLYGRFAGIDTAGDPFYDFELDYSKTGYVRIGGTLRETPRALSDIVATSLVMAQTKMYRTAYRQIAREWLAGDVQAPQNVRGQETRTYRGAWANFVGRGDHFESTYFGDDYSFQSYGVQAGMSFLSDHCRSFGLMFGREEGKLSNRSDKVEGEDYYLGFYYGRRFWGDSDFLAYIGGGWQTFDLTRTSEGYRYGSRYDGNTFNIDVELGRRVMLGRGWTSRPFVAADLEVVRTGSSTEKTLDTEYSNRYRGYKRSELAQFLVRAGTGVSKNWNLIDFHAGGDIRWNFGDKRPKGRIVYPATGGSVVGRGADLGRFTVGLDVGMNWYLSEKRHVAFYIDYLADIYLDRDGDAFGNTGALGFTWRF